MEEKEIRRHIRTLQETSPNIMHLIKGSPDMRALRRSLHLYLSHRELTISDPLKNLHSLERIIGKESINTFRHIISPGNEKQIDYSALRMLRDLARDRFKRAPPDLSIAFFEEVRHLFKAIEMRTRVYENKHMPTSLLFKGRRAAKQRSKDLDDLFLRAKAFMDRYRTGFDEVVVRRRRRNRSRILKALNATMEDWDDWRWQVRRVARTSRQLGRMVRLSRMEVGAINRARRNRIPFGVTPYYVHLFDNTSSRENDHAVRSQVIPPMDYVFEMARQKGNREEAFDFMLERDTSPVPLITRRYPMICILKPYNTCPQICVYCQRNWEIDGVLSKDAMASADDIARAVSWISEHPAIIEVLITGGDPLVMSNDRIDDILGPIAEIDHVERIRIGTRTPVTMPMRIDDGFVEVISKYNEPGRREICVITHVEHVYEVTPEMMGAVQAIKKAGIPVYNQMVFTIENSRRFEASALRRLIRLVGIDPYYTFSMKGKDETESLRVPLARLLQEAKEEARLLPGLARRDRVVYNVPKLGKNYLTSSQHHELISVLPDGRRVYEFHPWEKKIQLTETYIGVDVSIHDYLQKLRSRGEDPEDYSTIWFYY